MEEGRKKQLVYIRLKRDARFIRRTVSRRAFECALQSPARRGDCITRTTRVLYNFAREISVSLCGRVHGVSSSIVRSIRVSFL